MYKCSYYKYIATTVTGIAATLPVLYGQYVAHGHNNILISTAIITTTATSTDTTTAYLLIIPTSTLHFYYILYHSPLLLFVHHAMLPKSSWVYELYISLMNVSII